MKNGNTGCEISDSILSEAILAHVSDLVIVISSDLSIDRLNSASELFFQWPIKKVRGKNLLDLWKDQDATFPIPKNFFKNPKILGFNLDCKNGLGVHFNLNLTIYPLVLPDAQVAALIIGKNVEIKKNNIAYHLNGIIDAIPGCLYWKDCDGHYLGCNKFTAELAGLSSPAEVIGKTDEDLWGGQAESLLSNDQKVTKNGEIIVVNETLKTANGQWMHFTGLKMPLRDENNQIIGLIGNSIDITDRKKIEEDLRIAKEKAEGANYIMTEFISNMGHDLTTPISDVGGVAQMLSYYEDEYPEMKELIDTLMSRYEACETVRKRIINATAVANLNVKNETFSISQELLKLQQELSPAIGSKDLKLIIEPPKPKKDDHIETDREKFHDILFDLISNAIQFTEKGLVRISVLKKAGRFEIRVMDTGIGIPADKLDYIVTFRQACVTCLE